ncbi:MAG TPA: Nramp family divalent metal transporter [Rhizomicrobium sp.]
MNTVTTTTSHSLTDQTVIGIRDVLDGRKRGVRSVLLFAGPAVISSIAYVDPGNFATNIQAGAGFGYTLLWVVLSASLLGMLFQALSAKLGIVTGRNLAEMCRDHFPRRMVYGMWGVSELAAMSTDLAEFLGGALAIALLFDLPLMVGMVITGIATYGMLLLEKKGFRPMEIVIGVPALVIGVCYLTELLIASVAWGEVARGAVLPSIPNAAALTITVGIIGATVMPHALYLHSGLTQNRAPARTEGERKKLLRFSNREVVVALSFAGLVNMAMVIMAAAAFHAGHSEVAEIQTAYHTLTPLLGGGAAVIFLVSLLVSGLSSSTVGTMAGQIIMQGFVGFRIPVWVRRLVTMLPAFAIVAIGVDPTRALVMSQVVLSFALPLPMLALVWFTRSPAFMGGFANGRLTDAVAIAGTAAVLIFNGVLLAQAFGIA